MFEILYYPDGNHGPVRDHLTQLAKERPKAFARLALDLEVLGAEGLRSQQITTRPLGDNLWELKRLYDGIPYRVFFGVSQGAGWCTVSRRRAPRRQKTTLNLRGNDSER